MSQAYIWNVILIGETTCTNKKYQLFGQQRIALRENNAGKKR